MCASANAKKNDMNTFDENGWSQSTWWKTNIMTTKLYWIPYTYLYIINIHKKKPDKMKGNQYAYIKHQHQKKTNQEKLLGGTDKKKKKNFHSFCMSDDAFSFSRQHHIYYLLYNVCMLSNTHTKEYTVLYSSNIWI